MSHVDEGTLHALVDDALPPDERDAVQAHLATCGECARRFAEATAMARQVMSLLGALDEVPAAPVRVVPPQAAAPAAGTPVTPLRARMLTLRRVAIAASVMLVAGVSYQVGRSKDTSAVLEAPVPSAIKPQSVVVQPSVVTSADEPSAEYAPMPQARSAVPSGPRAALDAGGGAGASANTIAEAPQVPLVAVPTPRVDALPEASQRRVAVAPARVDEPDVERRARVQESQVADAPSQSVQGVRAAPSQVASESPASQQAPSRQVAQLGQAAAAAAPPPASADAADGRSTRPSQKAGQAELNAVVVTGVAAPVAGAPAAPKATPIPGYTATEEASQPAVIRRRYVSSAGTPLLLVIVQAATAGKAQAASRAESSPEFVVRTQNGRSTVRWQRDGRSYELQGALAPDSLVKLATQLK